MTEISAQNLVEHDRTDVTQMFVFMEIVRNHENEIPIKRYGWHLVEIWSRLEVCQKKVKILKVLRMGLPMVQNLIGLQESVLSLSRSSQLHLVKKQATC